MSTKNEGKKKSEVLKGEVRTKIGSRHARALRQEGRIPASLNADDTHEQMHLSVEEHGYLASRRRHTHLYEIELGGKLQMAVVRELQWDTLGDRIVHIDFKRVQKDVKTESEVELEFVGHPKGGVLNHLITHVTVRCIPALIPDSIEVPVGGLEQGGAVYGRELKVPEGVEILLAQDAKVAVVVAAAKPEAAPVAAPAEGATPAAATPPPAAT
jgi:large subunit ribosomal protein L25